MKYKHILFGVLLIIGVMVFGVYKLQNKETTGSKQVAAENESYKNYTFQTLGNELAAGNKPVIFFFADWCPDCRAADEAFRTKSKTIPTGITVLKIDYGSDKALERKYGVFSRHTFVQVGPNYEMVNKWISGDIDLLKKNIK